jgi:hypothetical protein
VDSGLRRNDGQRDNGQGMKNIVRTFSLLVILAKARIHRKR